MDLLGTHQDGSFRSDTDPKYEDSSFLKGTPFIRKFFSKGLKIVSSCTQIKRKKQSYHKKKKKKSDTYHVFS